MKADHEEIGGDNTPATSPGETEAPATTAEMNGTKEQMNDMDFWLSSNDAKHSPATTPAPSNQTEVKVEVTPVADISEDDEEQVKTKKKRKKDKKERKDKKEKKKHKNKLALQAEYEEADGITTPSKEQVPPSQEDTPVNTKPMSSYRLLAENSCIRLTCETRANMQRSDQVVVSMVFSNLTNNNINNLELNVMDTLNTKLIRGVGQTTHDAVRVPFVLPPSVSNEGQFAFSLNSISQPTRMKGTLTFMIKSEEGSTHDKLDFRVNIDCSAFLVPVPCKGPDFASLLSSGDLTEKSTMKCSPLDANFANCLMRICFYNHFKVVEKVDQSASLYSRSIQGHHVCLLVKLVNGELTVDGKSSDQTFLSNVLNEIKTAVTTDIS